MAIPAWICWFICGRNDPIIVFSIFFNASVFTSIYAQIV